MTTGKLSCPGCGFLLEPDCDFCPNCGLARSSANQTPPVTQTPHAWMQNVPDPAPRPNSGMLVQSPPPQIQPVPYVVSVPVPVAVPEQSSLPVAVRAMGIICLSLMLIGLIPCLGWLNYFNFAFGFVTLVLAIVALATATNDSARSSAIIGLLLVVIANSTGLVRLIVWRRLFVNRDLSIRKWPSAGEWWQSLRWVMCVFTFMVGLTLVGSFVSYQRVLTTGHPWLPAHRCPGCLFCGMTRSFCAMSDGSWVQAWQWNKGGPALYTFFWLWLLATFVYATTATRQFVSRRL